MPDFGIMRGFNEKLFGDKLVAGQLPTQLGLIGSFTIPEFLLDLYPGAAAAYSLRKLNSAYTGSAIRVRRTDLTESDIGFTATGNLDTTALLAFTGTGVLDNGFVKTWYDQSGNSNNLAQTTLVNQPQIVLNGSVIINLGSKPTVKFSGNQIIFKNYSLNIANPYTNISVNRFASFTSPGTFPYIMRNELGNDSQLTTLGKLFTNTLRSLSGSNLFHSLAGQINTNYLWFVIPNSIFTINNITTVGDLSIQPLVGGIVLGGYSLTEGQLNGYISEQIIYPSNQSLNQNEIQNNINDFYSIF